MSAPLPYGRQLIDEDDIAEVAHVLRSDFPTTGPEVDAFERELAATCGVRHAVVVANDTAALHCAYAGLQLTPGDEVIVPPLTFAATANMVLALGGRPVFADIDPDTLCLDATAVERALGPRTRGIAPVAFAGLPSVTDALRALARRHGLWLMEDGAHAIGGHTQGRPVGGQADATTFSLHPVKTITTDEGGAVVTNDAGVAQRARDLRDHGLVRERERLSRDDGPSDFEFQSLGLNYRLTAAQCALGRSQLRQRARFVERRAALVAGYRAAFADEPRLRLPKQGFLGRADGWDDAHW